MRHLFVISLFVFGFAATAHRVEGADVRMYIRHEVGDYATWRKTYDAFDATRKKLGARAGGLSISRQPERRDRHA
jgi:hypothetical protein